MKRRENMHHLNRLLTILHKDRKFLTSSLSLCHTREFMYMYVYVCYICIYTFTHIVKKLFICILAQLPYDVYTVISLYNVCIFFITENKVILHMASFN